MGIYIDILTSQISELCKIYETYIWRGKERRLAVIFKDNAIYFYVYEGYELVDELFLEFETSEVDVYRALALRLFAILLGNVYVERTDKVYHNRKHKPYLGVIIHDDFIREKIDLMVSQQDTDYINFDNKVIANAYKLVRRRLCSKKFLDNIEERIYLSEIKLRK